MPFSKFISLITYQALWYTKLKHFEDTFEGVMPDPAKKYYEDEAPKWKKIFPPDVHDQIDTMSEKNVEDGRELTIVNCWYLGESESRKMWETYAPGKDGVAIKSTIRKLASSFAPDPEFSLIGKVIYTDLETHKMTEYQANQACERALLKKHDFVDEQEVRVIGLNMKCPGGIRMDGTPFDGTDCSGGNVNNFENPGIYLGVHLDLLIDEIVLSPQAEEWGYLLVNRIKELSKLRCKVTKSALT